MVPIKGILRKVLVGLGDHSMNMWMTHTWFCFYLFHDFIYSLKYPLVIFAVVVLLSYGSSIIVNAIARPVKSLLITRKTVTDKAAA